jgi:hypothetical protein
MEIEVPFSFTLRLKLGMNPDQARHVDQRAIAMDIHIMLAELLHEFQDEFVGNVEGFIGWQVEKYLLEPSRFDWKPLQNGASDCI